MYRYSDQINIHWTEQKLKFYAIEYDIDIIGGLDIEVNDFYISLIDSDGFELRLSDFTFPIQSIHGWPNSIRKYSVKIPKDGIYLIKFNNPSSLIVRRTNFAPFPFSLFNLTIPNNRISVGFYRKM
jgi:hypothetical protein